MARMVKEHGVFAITSEGTTSFYFAQDFGELQEVVGRLRAVRTLEDRVPVVRGSEASRLTEYAQCGFPVAFTEKQRLFKPLEREEYDDLTEMIRSGDDRAASYVVDYDQNAFSVMRWYRGHLEQSHADLDKVIDAYTSALKDSGQAFLGVDMNKFNAALRELMVPGSLEDQLSEIRCHSSLRTDAAPGTDTAVDKPMQNHGPEMAM